MKASPTAGYREPRILSEPRPGFFKVRLVRGGPWVPARLYFGPPRDPETGEPLDRGYCWEAYIGGELLAIASPDPVKARVFDIWEFGREIEPAEYDFMIADLKHAKQFRPGDPKASPDKPIDFLKSPLPF